MLRFLRSIAAGLRRWPPSFVRTRRRVLLTGIFLTVLLSLGWNTGVFAQTIDKIEQGLTLSLFDARAPNPVPDVAPPLRAPAGAPTILLLPATPGPHNAPAAAAPAMTPEPGESAGSGATAGGDFVELLPAAKPVVYRAFDFLTGYLSNLNNAIVVDGEPWDVGSTNRLQWLEPRGGTSYWDYWSEQVPWDSPSHQWRDESGQWQRFTTETIPDDAGRPIRAYVLFERRGPGVMDKLWVTHDPTQSFMGILTQSNVFFWTSDPPEITEWGGLANLGNLRLEVDGRTVYDGPIQDWFSGHAQRLTPVLRQVLVWKYRQFGSNGNIIPIPYQERLKAWVYGGKAKPKWFMATGIKLPPGTRVQPYTGRPDDLPLAVMEQLAQTILSPERYLPALGTTQEYGLTVAPGRPETLSFRGAGTLGAIQFQLPKSADPRRLHLRVTYGDEVGIEMPLLALFGEPDQLALHHSSPIGVMDLGDDYMFYSNLPMPYRSGIEIELQADGPAPIPVAVRVALLAQTAGTELRAVYQPVTRLEAYGPDLKIQAPGDGRVAGLVLVTRRQEYDRIPRVIDPKTGDVDAAKKIWPMGYLEGNLTLSDGAGNARYYSGQEDWAEGGYYFNSGYTTPPGGANMPFAGILRYQGGKNGYVTLFRYFNDLSGFRFKEGLELSFGHGTWQNNFPVSYGATLLYYHEIPGVRAVPLPAWDSSAGALSPSGGDGIP